MLTVSKRIAILSDTPLKTIATMYSKYKLEPYKSGGSNRYQCPKCGKQKCYTRYIDIDTGEYAPYECGYCDHRSSCGYEKNPYEYYKEHPEANPNHVTINGMPAMIYRPTHLVDIQPSTPKPQTEFFNIRWAEQARMRSSPFASWFRSLPFESERMEEVLMEYYVGATAYDIVTSGTNYGPATVFWMIDEQMQVHDAKLIAYQDDGHRVSSWANSMRAICMKRGVGPQLNETEKVFFGLHLLNRYPDSTVCIVESEKSALICACRYPQYLWLATGGCSNLQVKKLRPLMNRRVALFPDSGMYDKWCSFMARSGHKNYNVTDYFEQFEPNTDIADVILGVAKLQPF